MSKNYPELAEIVLKYDYYFIEPINVKQNCHITEYLK